MDTGLINFNFQVNKASSIDYKVCTKEKAKTCEKFDNVLAQKVNNCEVQTKEKKPEEISTQNPVENKKDNTLSTTSTCKNEKKSEKKDEIVDGQLEGSIKKDILEAIDVLSEVAALIASKEIPTENDSTLLKNINEIQSDALQMIASLDEQTTNLIDQKEINNQFNNLINKIQTILEGYKEEIDPKYGEKLLQLKEALISDFKLIKNNSMTQIKKENNETLENEPINSNELESLESRADKINKKDHKDSPREDLLSDSKKQENNVGFFAHRAQKIEIDDQMIKGIPATPIIDQEYVQADIKPIVNTVGKMNFQNILEQVVEKGKVIVKENASEMTIQLKPDNLGKLSMKIEVERGIVIANIVAENQAVKEVLESNFNALRDSLNEKGFGIQQLNVTVGENSDFEHHQNFMNSKKRNHIKNRKESEYDVKAVEELQNITRSENTMQIDSLA